MNEDFSVLLKPAVPCESFFPEKDETIDAYFDRVIRLGGNRRWVDRRIERQVHRRSRVVPIEALLHLIKIPSNMRLELGCDYNGMERVRLRWHVTEALRDDRKIWVATDREVPDINDWALLAKFFYVLVMDAMMHEAGEQFWFARERPFNPHLYPGDEAYEAETWRIRAEVRRAKIESKMARSLVDDFTRR